MRYVFLTTIFVSLVSFTMSELASASVINYQIGTVAKTEATCAEAADAYAQKFTASTGTAVIRSACVSESDDGYQVQLTFNRLSSARLVSAIFNENGSDASPADFPEGDRAPLGKGTYRSVASCLADSPERAAVFRTETGLTPFAVYCYQGYSFGVVLRIDAFGSSRRRFYATEYVTQGITNDPFLVQLADLLMADGATVESTRRTSRGAVAFYYAGREIELISELASPGLTSDFSTFFSKTASDCATEGTVLKDTLDDVGLTMTLDSCLEDFRGRRFYFNYVVPVGRVRLWHRYQSGPTYANYASCVADRDAAIQSLSGSVPGLKTMLCLENDQYTGRASVRGLLVVVSYF